VNTKLCVFPITSFSTVQIKIFHHSPFNASVGGSFENSLMLDLHHLNSDGWSHLPRLRACPIGMRAIPLER
jgi:hypothetical protein